MEAAILPAPRVRLMPERCVACGEEVGDGAARCPSCGLAFVAPGDEAALTGAAPPPHVGLVLGEVPQAVSVRDDGGPAAEETPLPARRIVRPPPHVRRRRVLFGGLSAIAAVVLAVLLVRAHRPDDQYTALERMFERFLDADALANVEVPDGFDADAVIADAVKTDRDREALRAAAAAHRVLPDHAPSSVHEFFEAFLERLLEISPDHALSLGVRPIPARITPEDDVTGFRWMLLCRDASRTLRTWPSVERLSPHDRADRDALLALVDCELRSRPPPDDRLLALMTSWFDPLVHLARVPCGTSEERIAAATTRLVELPAHLRNAVDVLEAPSLPIVLATARELEAAAAFLDGYATSWSDVPSAALLDLGAATGPARDATAECARRLRNSVAPRATKIVQFGRERTALMLRIGDVLPGSAGDPAAARVGGAAPRRRFRPPCVPRAPPRGGPDLAAPHRGAVARDGASGGGAVESRPMRRDHPVLLERLLVGLARTMRRVFARALYEGLAVPFRQADVGVLPGLTRRRS